MASVRSRKIKRPQDPALKLGKSLLPKTQADRGGFVVVDAPNHTDSDQRHAVRSGETKTLRRLTKLERLHRQGALTKEQLAICEWYHDAYTFGMVCGQGVTANYGGAGGTGPGVYTHFAKDKAQMLTRQEYEAARASIPHLALPVFERVVIHGRPMGRLTRTFRLAVESLRDFLGDRRIFA